MNNRMRLGKYLRALMVAGDFLIINLAYLITVACAGTVVAGISQKWIWVLVNVAFIPSELIFSAMHNLRIQYIDRVLIKACKSCLLAMCVLAALFYIAGVSSAMLWHLGLFFVFFLLLLSLWWLLSRMFLKKIRRIGFNYKRVVIVGAGMTAKMVSDELRSDAGYGYRIMGFFSPDRKGLGGMDDAGASFYGDMEDLQDFVRLNKIDTIYYTLDAEDHDMIAPVIELAEEVGAGFVYVPKYNRILYGQFQPYQVGNLPAMIHSFSPLNRGVNRFVKRVFDLSVSIPFLIVSPLVFVPIAIVIKLTSKGPVFFKQKRTGIYGTEFVCYKFRTMKVNAASDTVQATADDKRKTRFGDFLRRSSLDELPQFYNVLLGNMSVVGPRPHMVKHTEEYLRLIDKYMVRHAVKPGITGWAQVNGYRGGTKHLWQMEKRVEYDVWYIRNWNILLDLKIVFLTILNGIRGDENAY